MTVLLSPLGGGIPKSPSVTVSLDPAYDTDTLGDGLTSVSKVRLMVDGLASNSISWLDKDGNTTFDIGNDILVANGGVTTSLTAGQNSFRFYQQSWNAEVSAPSYFSVYYDADKAGVVNQEQNSQLAKASIAYLGRPLTPSEQAYLAPLLSEKGLDSVLRFLAGSLECQAIYATASYEAAIERLYGILFARSASTSEIQYTKELLDQNGNSVYLLPWLVAKGALASDLSVLNSKVIFAEEATTSYSSNLAAAAVSERTLIEVERSSLNSVKALADAASQLEALVQSAKNAAKSATQLTAPSASLDIASDTGPIGDATTSASAAKLAVNGITPGAIAWLDNNKNSFFDVGVDYPVINGAVNVTLNRGTNTFVFYQSLDSVISAPGYISILRTDSGLPPSQPSPPVISLNSADDDGSNSSDNLTSKNLVTLNISNLNSKADKAWLERDGNGIFDLGTDISLQVGNTVASAIVSLKEGLNGFSAYQTVEGLTSQQGTLSVTLLKSTTVVNPLSRYMTGSTISLEFDTAINWQALDRNGDGYLAVSKPGKGGELQITWGSTKGGAVVYDFSGDLPATGAWLVPTPAYGSRFLTVNDVSWGDSDPAVAGQFSLLLIGVPDVSGSITSNVNFTWDKS